MKYIEKLRHYTVESGWSLMKLLEIVWVCLVLSPCCRLLNLPGHIKDLRECGGSFFVRFSWMPCGTQVSRVWSILKPLNFHQLLEALEGSMPDVCVWAQSEIRASLLPSAERLNESKWFVHVFFHWANLGLVIVLFDLQTSGAQLWPRSSQVESAANQIQF